jgi:hypothetical protein
MAARKPTAKFEQSRADRYIHSSPPGGLVAGNPDGTWTLISEDAQTVTHYATEAEAKPKRQGASRTRACSPGIS